MNTKQIANFLRGLHRNTLDGNVSWQDGGNDIYFTILKDVKVLLEGREGGPFDEMDYFVKFETLDGIFIEEFSDVDLKSVQDNSYSLMKETYKTARLRALGLEQKLDDALMFFDDDFF